MSKVVHKNKTCSVVQYIENEHGPFKLKILCWSWCFVSSRGCCVLGEMFELPRQIDDGWMDDNG